MGMATGLAAFSAAAIAYVGYSFDYIVDGFLENFSTTKDICSGRLCRLLKSFIVHNMALRRAIHTNALMAYYDRSKEKLVSRAFGDTDWKSGRLGFGEIGLRTRA